jgi:DNA-binding NarL/FixJ family response regulator
LLIVSKRILVADDSPLMRNLLCRAFHEHIYLEICAEAKDGAEAVQLAKRHKPDLVILDFAMPGMSGVEAGIKIPQIYPKIPSVVFTMHAPVIRKAQLPWATRSSKKTTLFESSRLPKH